jgi:class 3 adenylate cyclase/tetratricopeptide (TPR) repeat protein
VNCPACGATSTDTGNFCPRCGSSLAPRGSSQEARKNVTMLFIDIVGSTALAERLDPESWGLVMDRYFAACRSSVIEHGGAVEKFIGDAVLAVFGAAVVHEDDAVRAVRAAAQALAALAGISADVAASHQVSLEARCGICSGEVMVITAPGEDFRVVGDAVNTASRLQTAARPGEILIGAKTAALVRGHSDIEPVPALRLKGKARAVPAWRVTDPVASHGDGSVPPGAPLIGREDELEELRQSFRRVTRRRQPCLVTVLGAPGVGKSRLAREFAATLAASGADRRPVTVMSGRCSAYGRGITYAPLTGMLSSCPGGWPDLARLLSGSSGGGRRAARSLATIMAPPGDDASRAAASAGSAGIEEIAWAVRCLVERLGATGPVIMIWEDLHWAEATLLDLIDEIATWLTDVPVLLLCMARTELLEARPSWGGGKPCAMTIELGPLSHEHSAALVSELIGSGEVQAHGQHELLSRVAVQCDGNPLFAELMLDVFAETASGAPIPPTIQAFLGARLDQLPAGERQLLEIAATIGRDFPADGLRALAVTDGIAAADLESRTARLIRRHVIQRAGSGQLRFAQALLRDAAYASVPKARRERWHTFLAQWYADHPAQAARESGPGASLAVAHHVEAACQLRRELLPGAASLPPLAGRAADALAAEGMSALSRKDLPAAAALLERSRELLPAGDPRHAQLALHICDSWIGLWDQRRALAALSAAEAAAANDPRGRVTCAIQRCIVLLRLGLATAESVAAQVGQIEADLASVADDDLNWCRYHQARAYLHLAGERAASADASLRLSLARARAMADAYEEERLLCAICEVAQWTPAHRTEGLELCGLLTQRFAANRALLVPVLVTRAYLDALGGRLGAARRDLATAASYAGDLHLDRSDAAVLETSGFVASLAGAHGQAEAHYRRAAAALRAAQDAPAAAMLEAAMGRALFDQGRTAEAAAALGRLEAERGDMLPRTQIVTAGLRGRLASAAGAHDRAVAAARRAADLSSGTDDPCLAGAALFDLAMVLKAAGRAAEAAAAATAARERFEAKGASLPARRVRDWLARAAGEPGGAARA